MKPRLYRVRGELRVTVEMNVSADSRDEAIEKATDINQDEWLSWDVLGAHVEDVEVVKLVKEKKAVIGIPPLLG